MQNRIVVDHEDKAWLVGEALEPYQVMMEGAGIDLDSVNWCVDGEDCLIDAVTEDEGVFTLEGWVEGQIRMRAQVTARWVDPRFPDGVDPGNPGEAELVDEPNEIVISTWEAVS